MSDTSREAAEIQDGIHRRMTGAERLRLAVEMSIAARELTLARLRAQHPEWSDRELKRELLRYAFGSAPLPEPLR
ncbi:MAG TPA: hypothetical protein VF615_10575 [Longimicrobiaceae bacterium]|jgi:hypothetical protein